MTAAVFGVRVSMTLSAMAMLAVLVAAQQAAWAQQLSPGPGPVAGNPSLSVTRPIQAWPKVLPGSVAKTAPQPAAQPAQPAPPVPVTGTVPAPGTTAGWSPAEIQLAQSRCKALLQGLSAVAVPEVPLHEGRECGTPAPMKLLSIGKNPQVALSPPPIVTCDMVAALSKWVERDLQPLARKNLGAPIIRIDTMSSYSCRNAYGRAHGKLSEHGRANAVDIGAFVTSSGRSTMVIADWGPTAREIAAQVAAAKAAGPAQGQVQALPAGIAVAPKSMQEITAAKPPDFKPAITFTLPGGATLPGLHPSQDQQMGLSPLNRLGGPKPQDTKQGRTPGAATAQGAQSVQSSPATDGRMDFLRAAHSAACKVFGTVLGPEANRAHRNHFHVDMAERPHGVICE